MSRIRIALQLYSIREECNRDLAGCLKAVADMGYEGVEFAGYYGYDAEKLREILDRYGLEIAGSHIGVNALLEDSFDNTVEFNRTLGNRFIIVPGLPEYMRNSRDRWIETANLFDRLADKLRRHGIRIGYHNHTLEFKPIDGEIPWDIFFRNTKREVVMQLDTGNAMRAGVTVDEILDIVRRYPGRAVTVHLKEYSKKSEKVVIGEGEMRWREFIDLCLDVGGTEWFIVEQESYPYPPLECVKRCIDNLKRILGI
ncbi:MAG: sugar phosphate isomerase/epimerase [Candidatus Bathyarchaeota archaeon]|nr:sugar phosphate isomerase/epimerase [Candidatus Bathyarchaeota archaeon]